MPNNERSDQIELRSEEVQEILTKVPHWMIRWGSVLFLSLILLLLFISWFVKYPDVIECEALISTEIPPQKEYAKITGRLDVILVSDNENVKENTPLAILENTANYKDVYLLKSIVDTLKVSNKDFYFPLDSLPILFLGDIDTQFALFENNYIQYRLNKELSPFSNQALANSTSIAELQRRLKNLKSQRNINKTELELTRIDKERHKTLFEKGVISEQEYEQKQLVYAQSERNFKNFEASISQLQESLSNAKANAKDTDINKIREEMSMLKTVIQSFNQLKRAIIDWEQMYVLKSNINGRVSFLSYWNANQTVKQGDLVFTIIPNENSSFIAKLKTPALNSGKIEEGQQVTIRLQNYPDQEFGTIKGKVARISALPNEEGLYFVDAILPDKLITSHDLEIDFKQEMRGSASIITEDLRLIERFFYQLRQVFTR